METIRTQFPALHKLEFEAYLQEYIRKTGISIDNLELVQRISWEDRDIVLVTFVRPKEEERTQ